MPILVWWSAAPSSPGAHLQGTEVVRMEREGEHCKDAPKWSSTSEPNGRARCVLGAVIIVDAATMISSDIQKCGLPRVLQVWLEVRPVWPSAAAECA